MSLLIVGCGPVGMTLAGLLAQHGEPVQIIDKRLELSTLPRGIAVNQASLAVFDQLGIGAQLDALGLRVPRMNLYRRKTYFADINFSQLDIARPHFFHLTQDVIERALYRRITDLGVPVRQGLELQALEETPTGVIATCVHIDGREERILADHVIACDGGNSTARRLLDIPVDQSIYAGYFVVADVAFDALPLANEEMHCFCGVDGYLMIVPIPGGYYRVIASFPGEDPQSGFDAAFIERILREMTPIEATVRHLHWITHSAFGHRIASRARVGRVFFAGDAWHQFSPIGGTNMNLGIEDAAVLARAILARDLDAYELPRLEAVARNLAVTRYLSRLLVRSPDLATTARPFRAPSLKHLLHHELPRFLTGLRTGMPATEARHETEAVTA
ncbi:FAD-dependent oxidoreductase [Ralstonia sp. UBA689]|uniref:FAD-dependent oxidoreductase n=1 Tax=Ralstonia sp. UBA689 TaxID=1947373 RepID=UPI0025FB67E2|nr:NAD(P)/FAD-dependent oxidoreductase [Ralstonia sp. UBA689]